MRRHIRAGAGLLILVGLAACGGSSGGPPSTTSTPKLGGPNPGLTEAQLASFDRGQALFEHRFRLAEGHGPEFNTNSCRSCHELPVTGGSSPLYRNFSIVADEVGGGLQPVQGALTIVARNFSYERVARETIPADAEVIAQRNAPATFGMGLLERISAADIRANEDPADLNGDGIRGRVNFDFAPIGRFGFKAQEAGLEDFIRGPLFNHLGITTQPLSFGPLSGGLSIEQQVSAPESPTEDDDDVEDPEMSFEQLRDLLMFVRELAPPPQLPMDEQAQHGETLFRQARCDDCHIPNLVTDGDPVFAFTDLLIHEMGPELADGVVMGIASGSEFRTAPLWGLRHHAPYLHDGRADTIADAIAAHGGTGATSRDLFAGLDSDDQAALIAYLETR
ncbi:MAG: di-heme oxidoredictase family protein [Planctomycetota bacterium]